MGRIAKHAAAVAMVVAVTASAPPAARAADLPSILTEYSVASWGQKDGFPLGSTWAIVQDEDGYLWLGTDTGLFRFDGVRFVPWSAPQVEPPLRGSVRSLLVARDGSLWIGYGESGRAVRLHHGESRIYGEAEGLTQAALTAFAEDPDGRIWAATGRGLYRLDGDRWSHAGADVGLPDGPAYSIRFTRRHEMIVGTGAGIFRRSGAAPFGRLDTFYEGVPRSISESADGHLYVTDSVVGFRPLDDGSVDAHRRGRGYALFNDSHDNLWVGTLGQGLWRVRRRGADYSIERTIELTGLSSDGVMVLMEDRDGNLWAGTSEGLNRLIPRRIIRVTDLGLVTGVEPGPDGDLWASTNDELLQFSASKTEAPLARVGAHGSRLRTMFANKRGLWAVTDRGLVRLEQGRTLVPVTGTQSLRQVSALTADGSGTLWLYDQGRGLFTLRGAVLAPFELPDAHRGERVTLMYVDANDNLWLAFASGQLGQIASGTFKMFDAHSGYVPATVQAIYQDRDQVLWFARNDGLGRFADGRFTTLSRPAGFPLSLTAIAEDEERNFWFGSTLGIARIGRAELEKAVAGHSAQVQYTLFDRSDGIAGTPQAYYSLGRPVARASDGRLWFVTGSGMTVIDPKALETVRPPSPVRVERVIANDDTLLPTPGLRLPPRSSRLQFDYTVVNLTSPLRTHFRYRLEGFDADWIDAGTRRQAYYTNVPPKRYRFQVVASNSEGTPLSETAWEFSIEPMFYQTRWFSAAIVGLFALAGWGAWRLRLRQVRRAFSITLHERNRLSREIHDTLLQSLVGVALQFDALAGELPASAGRTREQLIRMRKQVEEHIREARHSIWNLRSPALRRRDLGTALRAFAEQAAASTAMTVGVDVTGAPARRVPRIEEQLLRIGQEAITNAVRHSGASRIQVRLDYRRDEVVLSVADDGRGFDYARTASQPNGHYGLITMKERAAEIGGTLSIESLPAGTQVRMVVPQSTRVHDHHGERVDVGA
jgi:signal transduction histidine kinase/ligand-binding sensor domain-containing protein